MPEYYCPALVQACLCYLAFTEKTRRNLSNQNIKPELIKKQGILHELYLIKYDLKTSYFMFKVYVV